VIVTLSPVSRAPGRGCDLILGLAPRLYAVARSASFAYACFAG